MKKQLPPRPNLDQLKNQAKDLVKLHKSVNPAAIKCIKESHPRFASVPESEIRAATFSLSDAQLLIAREHGFPSWPKLNRYVEDLAGVERDAAELREAFAKRDPKAQQRIAALSFIKDRFEQFNPTGPTLSEADARLVLAQERGHVLWQGYESYLHLDPAVRDVIAAVREGDLPKLQRVLQDDPSAANPKYVPGFEPSKGAPNESVPLFIASQAIYAGTNRKGNGYEIARALIQAGADLNRPKGNPPLVAAASYRAPGVAQALLEAGAAADGIDGDGSPMALALHFDGLEVAEVLAKHGAKLDLRFAAGLGRLDLVQGFFNPDGSLKPDAGALADPFTYMRRERGQSPLVCERTRANILMQALYFACLHARLAVAEFLLQQGADINGKVPGLDSEMTVLHHLCRPVGEERVLPVVKLLLDRGASVRIKERDYQATAVDKAGYFNCEQIKKLLFEHGDSDLFDAVEWDGVERAQKLLAENPKLVHERDPEGATPLHYLHAGVKRGEESINLLVSHGADINARDNEGKTPLDKMLSIGRNDLAEVLRRHGA